MSEVITIKSKTTRVVIELDKIEANDLRVILDTYVDLRSANQLVLRFVARARELSNQLVEALK